MTTPLSSQHVLTSIISPLRTIMRPTQPETSEDPVSHVSHYTILSELPEASQEQAKSALLTLHFLFPHELLPALDLIDRSLITQLSVDSTSTGAQAESASVSDDNRHNITVFYVQSASSTSSAQSHGRFRNALSKTNQFYEVRLDGWNCTCPAFAYSTLKLLMKDLRSRAYPENKGDERRIGMSDIGQQHGGEKIESENEFGWAFGGSATKEDAIIPICKHILAVTLVNGAPGLFGGALALREVSREEMAAWAAGWGEH